MDITVTVDHATILRLIREYVLTFVTFVSPSRVKSKENYRLKTWETADIVATNADDKYPQIKAEAGN